MDETKENLTNPGTWVGEHGDILFRYALLRLRDPGAAEEVVQETFLAGLKSKDSFSGRSSERTWLVGILKHKIVDYIRKRSRERPTAGADAASTLDNMESEVFDDKGHWKPGSAKWLTDPDSVQNRGEIREAIGECIDELPGKQADAFTLRELEDINSKEVCKLLGITETNLWVMLHRARLKLRGCLADNYDEELGDDAKP